MRVYYLSKKPWKAPVSISVELKNML